MTPDRLSRAQRNREIVEYYASRGVIATARRYNLSRQRIYAILMKFQIARRPYRQKESKIQ